jgi:hypothetical protein
MIGSGGSIKVFWSNGLVGTITTLAIVLLFWPVIDRILRASGGRESGAGVVIVIARSVATKQSSFSQNGLSLRSQ